MRRESNSLDEFQVSSSKRKAINFATLIPSVHSFCFLNTKSFPWSVLVRSFQLHPLILPALFLKSESLLSESSWNGLWFPFQCSYAQACGWTQPTEGRISLLSMRIRYSLKPSSVLFIFVLPDLSSAVANTVLGTRSKTLSK